LQAVQIHATWGKRRVTDGHERPRAAGRYTGCYVRATVSGDFSDHTLASDAHLHTCKAGARGLSILRRFRGGVASAIECGLRFQLPFVGGLIELLLSSYW